MYNRYTQKPDGSFQRNQVSDFPPQNPPRQKPPLSVETHPVPSPERKMPPIRQEYQENPLGNAPSPFSFMKQLLPKGFDMGDLAIVFLLLLMAGDKEENRNTALLTIALYFIM